MTMLLAGISAGAQEWEDAYLFSQNNLLIVYIQKLHSVWILNPIGLLDCPYFVENTDMTVDKFIELYYEILRYLKD